MPAKKSKNKQAVVIIHGIGEQVPMETLQDFVDAAWSKDDTLIRRDRRDGNTGHKPRTSNPVWTKPDKRNRSFELRRITTETDDHGKRTDFYEYYWAHLMHGTTWEQVKAWVTEIIFRWPRDVPRPVFAAWCLIWLVLIVLGLAFITPVREWVLSCPPIASFRIWMAAHIAWILPVAGLVGSALLVKLRQLAKGYIGDVARYVKASPVNVARRQEIREKGVQLLETLMGVDEAAMAARNAAIANDEIPDWDTEYDRIIIAGHSLGSIVGYDILKHCFARVNKIKRPGFAKMDDQPERFALEEYLQNGLLPKDHPDHEPFDLDEYRKKQRASLKELQAAGNPWIVSDFVTLGSPLTHAEFLMGKDADDIDAQKCKRILPTCPPILEWDSQTDKDHFTYLPESEHGSKKKELKAKNFDYFRYPHHAAHFAYTRWTNIYSRSSAVVIGDLVSGPLGDKFPLTKDGISLAGIKDVAVLPKWENGKRAGPLRLLTHTKYWKIKGNAKAPYHVQELRNALDLLDQRDR